MTQNHLPKSWKCSTKNAATAIFYVSQADYRWGRKAVGQQNAECVKFLADFRKWGFHV